MSQSDVARTPGISQQSFLVFDDLLTMSRDAHYGLLASEALARQGTTSGRVSDIQANPGSGYVINVTDEDYLPIKLDDGAENLRAKAERGESASQLLLSELGAFVELVMDEHNIPFGHDKEMSVLGAGVTALISSAQSFDGDTELDFEKHVKPAVLRAVRASSRSGPNRNQHGELDGLAPDPYSVSSFYSFLLKTAISRKTAELDRGSGSYTLAREWAIYTLQDERSHQALRSLLVPHKKALMLSVAGFSIRQIAGIVNEPPSNVGHELDDGYQQMSEYIANPPEPLYGFERGSQGQVNRIYLEVARKLQEEPGFKEWQPIVFATNGRDEVWSECLRLGDVAAASHLIHKRKPHKNTEMFRGTVDAFDQMRRGMYRVSGTVTDTDIYRSRILSDGGFGVVDRLSWENRIAMTGYGLGLQRYELQQMGFILGHSTPKRAIEAFDAALKDPNLQPSLPIQLCMLARDIPYDELVDMSRSMSPRQRSVLIKAANGRVQTSSYRNLDDLSLRRGTISSRIKSVLGKM